MGKRKPPEGIPLVRVVVPNRVDIAGGTLDIFPLYLLVPGSMTVNAAIRVSSVVSIRSLRATVRLVSENFSLRAEAGNTHRFPTRGKFGLIAAALRSFPPQTGIELRFRNEAPLGSGIGASSALLVATMLAICRLLGIRKSWRVTAREAMEIEAAHLRSLTGSQDHIAALRGGIQGIRYLPGRTEPERIAPGSPVGRIFAAHGFLACTGMSHFSAGLNWRMIRGAIDGNPEALRRFRGIADAARDAWEAVSEGEIAQAGRAMAREWAIRRTTARGISTKKVDGVFSSPEFRRWVSGAKLCGAGGGGMLFGLLRDPGDRETLESVLESRGVSPFPFRISAGPQISGAGGFDVP
jgi:D-glycero-alpha-D-manno-heptose-7-phosphate kinase